MEIPNSNEKQPSPVVFSFNVTPQSYSSHQVSRPGFLMSGYCLAKKVLMENYKQVNATDDSTGIEDVFSGKLLFVHDKIIQKQVYNHYQDIQDAGVCAKPFVGGITHAQRCYNENAHEQEEEQYVEQDNSLHVLGMGDLD